MEIETAAPCGNPQCGTSTGIHEGLTFGSGRLSGNGYWENPCRVCAARYDATNEERVERIRRDYLDKGMTPEEVEKHLRDSHEWVFIPCFPFEDTDLEEERKKVRAEIEREEGIWRGWGYWGRENEREQG